jgi:hypothetical protein
MFSDARFRNVEGWRGISAAWSLFQKGPNNIYEYAINESISNPKAFSTNKPREAALRAPTYIYVLK